MRYKGVGGGVKLFRSGQATIRSIMFFSTGFSFTSSYCFFLNYHTDPYQSHFHCVS